MSNVDDDKNIICYSACHKCNRRIKIECYDDNFETKENVTFLGRLGTETYSYCPYCGVKQTGFSMYETKPAKFTEEEDVAEVEWDDEEFWWPDAEGVTLVDDEEEENEHFLEIDDESATETFVCPACGEKFRVHPKGLEKHFCYYCGKKI